MQGRGIYGSLIAVLMLMAVMMVLMQGVLVAGITAQTSGAVGTVEVLRGGKGEPIPLANTNGGRVKVGDVLRTGPESGVTLIWADGTKIEVGASTQIEVRKYQFDSKSLKQVSLLRLDFGDVWARVAHKLGTDSRFEIETPTTVAGVRGTIFHVSADPAATTVEVVDGQVAVRRHDGKEALIAPGQALLVTATDSTATAAGGGETRGALQPSLTFQRLLPIHVQDGQARLMGRVEPGAALEIDGAKVTVDPDGRFEHSVPVKPGRNAFAVVVTDAAGHRFETSHAVKVD